jgi:hypothetical protein
MVFDPTDSKHDKDSPPAKMPTVHHPPRHHEPKTKKTPPKATPSRDHQKKGGGR